jgi:4-aminobutyrate aminotransferase/(S)-3-amino-2-methylpropionate transaminase
MYKAKSLRGGSDPSELDLSSCMKNQAPGTPNLSILSFTSAFHGRMFGSLSTTQSKAIHKIDIPGFDWPKANVPRYKYPLEDHEDYNKEQDDLSVKHVQELIAFQRDQKNAPVAAIIIEPILSEGGDIYISKNFA